MVYIMWYFCKFAATSIWMEAVYNLCMLYADAIPPVWYIPQNTIDVPLHVVLRNATCCKLCSCFTYTCLSCGKIPPVGNSIVVKSVTLEKIPFYIIPLPDCQILLQLVKKAPPPDETEIAGYVRGPYGIMAMAQHLYHLL